MIELNQETATRVLQAAAQAGPQNKLTLAAGDGEHRALAADLLTASGRGADRFPALHQALATGAGTHEGGADDVQPLDAGVDAQGRATARTWVSSRQGALLSGATVMLLDPDSRKVLASGSATQVNGSLVQAATRTAEALPATERMTAVTFQYALQSATAAPRFSLAVRPVSLAAVQTGPQVTVNDPRLIRSAASPIVIGMARDAQHQNADADYAYPSAQNVNPDRYPVPFTGTASLPYETNVSPQNPVHVTTRLYVTSFPQWVGLRAGFDVQPGMTATGYDLTWNWPFDALPIDQTASLQYDIAYQSQEPLVDFFFQFGVPVQFPTQPIYTFTVCSQDTPDAPSTGCTVIPQLEYWWHCVGAGTMVTMADGSLAPVEKLDNTSVVRTGYGHQTAPVIATSCAYHQDNGGSQPSIRLRTKGGREVLLTHGHPVSVPSGIAAAHELREGDHVRVEQGMDFVASVTPERHEGIVYNLKLDPAAITGQKYGSFVANGIVVGDHLAQAAHHRSLRHDVDYVLARIPVSHHPDFLSALADATAR